MSSIAKRSKEKLIVILNFVKKIVQWIYDKGKIKFHRSNSFTAEKFANGRMYAKEYYSRLKAHKDKRRLKKLPWYLILGSPQSGKKSLITNFELYFAQAKHFGEEAENYIKQFPDYDWWFSEQAVLIDAIGQVNDAENTHWKSFIKLLKRERKQRPINGIILSFSLPDILLYSNQRRQEFLQDICFYIREIHTTFKAQVPVYLIFTKADLIEGFMEFFNELSKDELRQVWGMTIPFAVCDDPEQSLRFYNEEFSAMVNILRQHVLWSLDAERNSRGRELIHTFPQQMQLLRRPIETFLMELFNGVRYKNALLLRGIYFGSNKQQGEPHDFMLQAMSKKFQLIPPQVQRPQRMGECYFFQRLFHDVIYPEANYLGESERSRKTQVIGYYATRTLAPIVLIAAMMGMHEGYLENINRLAVLQNNITEFQQLQLGLTDDTDSLLQVLPLLNKLNSAVRLYQENLPIGMHFLFETASIRNQLKQALQRTIRAEFIPRVTAKIENYLNQNIINQNLLYATLKAYLAFSPSSNTKADAIIAPLTYHWNQDYLSKPSLIKSLNYYLNLALKSPLVKLPVDSQLISRIRDELEAIIPSQRAYGLLQLRASVSDLPKLYINSAVGSNFDDVFSTNKTQIAIPALYTTAGYRELFLAEYQPIAEEVSEDNQAIGLEQDDVDIQTTAEIIKAMQETYQQNTIRCWMKGLLQLKIKLFSDLNNAIDTLQLLTSSESPLQRLLAVVYDNTNNIPVVTSRFAVLNQFQKNSWSAIQQTLLSLQNSLLAIQGSADVNHAEYQAVLNALQTGQSPIITLTEQANHAPQPLKQWLNGIADSSWNILIAGAHSYVNTIWQTTVLPGYNSNIAGRYPTDPHASVDININDFNQFFSPSGTLATFFNNTLKPFIQTDQPLWILNQIQGHNFELSADTIALFQQANLIQTNYFNGTSQLAKLGFSIKPLLLDSNASSARLLIGRTSITYSHGPQEITNLSWPMSTDNQRVALILSTFSGVQFTRSSTGPWAIFKLLDQGSFSEQQIGNYIFAITIAGHNVSYQFLGSADQSIYQLSNLKNFNLPNLIAG